MLELRGIPLWTKFFRNLPIACCEQRENGTGTGTNLTTRPQNHTCCVNRGRTGLALALASTRNTNMLWELLCYFIPMLQIWRQRPPRSTSKARAQRKACAANLSAPVAREALRKWACPRPHARGALRLRIPADRRALPLRRRASHPITRLAPRRRVQRPPARFLFADGQAALPRELTNATSSRTARATATSPPRESPAIAGESPENLAIPGASGGMGRRKNGNGEAGSTTRHSPGRAPGVGLSGRGSSKRRGMKRSGAFLSHRTAKNRMLCLTTSIQALFSNWVLVKTAGWNAGAPWIRFIFFY
jgi:hypothetical protein